MGKTGCSPLLSVIIRFSSLLGNVEFLSPLKESPIRRDKRFIK
ncbi:unnamed protein product, partial [Rotaria sordida]